LIDDPSPPLTSASISFAISLIEGVNLPRPCGRPLRDFLLHGPALPPWPGVEGSTDSTVPALNIMMCSHSQGPLLG